MFVTSAKPAGGRRRRARLHVSPLEGRALPAVFTVTSTADAGPGSLRQAVLDANAAEGDDEIVFDVGVFATPQTVVLTGGELTVSSSITIRGPGPGRLTVSGNNSSRVFNSAGGSLTVNDATISGGNAPSGPGGALVVGNATVTLNRVHLTGNRTAAGDGGAAALGYYGQLTLNDCTVSANKANGGHGGAVSMNSSVARVTANRCVFIGNTASLSGGAVDVNYGLLVVNDSTLDHNSVTYGNGGAVSLCNAIGKFTNCTMTANTCGINGGGGALAGLLDLRHCTITANQAPGTSGRGGGVLVTGHVLTLVSTVIAGNSCGLSYGGQDIRRISGVNTLPGNNSLIGILDPTDYVILTGGYQAGTSAKPLDAKLGPLANNGGPTPTHALLPGSPAIDAGINPATLNYDQRGVGYRRVAGSFADIGAFEVQLPHVLGVTVNDGSAQRSRVTSMRVTFDQPVTLPANPASAFSLVRQAGGAVGLAAAVDNTGPGTVVTLTWTGGAVEFDSLADGRYTLTVSASKVNAGNFDGNDDNVIGDDFVLVGTPFNRLFRLFGDADGDADVDAIDLQALRTAFGGVTNLAFDHDNDGDVDAADYSRFRRYGSIVP